MKTFLVVAAVLGLTSSAAFADCAGHKVTASTEVDKTFTTASITTAPATTEPMQANQPADAERSAPQRQKATQ